MKTTEIAEIRSTKYLLDGYKPVMVSRLQSMPGGVFMRNIFRNLIEDIKSVYSIELVKLSPRKWQIVNIYTEDNSYNVEDDNFYLSPANYDLSRLTEQVEIYQYNSFFGIRLESVCKHELELYPNIFRVEDEHGAEITQEELKLMHDKQQARRV